MDRCLRLAVVALPALFAPPALALQCRALTDIAEASPTVVIAHPLDVLRRPSQVPGFAWVRFGVTETLKGAPRTGIDALCAVGDLRCRPRADAALLVLALPPASELPTLGCRMDYLDPPAAMGPADPRLREKVRAWRTAQRRFGNGPP